MSFKLVYNKLISKRLEISPNLPLKSKSDFFSPGICLKIKCQSFLFIPLFKNKNLLLTGLGCSRDRKTWCTVGDGLQAGGVGESPRGAAVGCVGAHGAVAASRAHLRTGGGRAFHTEESSVAETRGCGEG